MWTRAGARGGVAVGGGRRRRGQAALFRGGKRPKICHESRQNMFLFFRFLKTHSTSRVVSGRVCGGAVARFNACHCPFHSLPLTFSLPSHCLPALIMRRCQKHRGCGRYRRMRCFRPTRLTVRNALPVCSPFHHGPLARLAFPPALTGPSHPHQGRRARRSSPLKSSRTTFAGGGFHAGSAPMHVKLLLLQLVNTLLPPVVLVRACLERRRTTVRLGVQVGCGGGAGGAGGHGTWVLRWRVFWIHLSAEAWVAGMPAETSRQHHAE